jgi:hypothetical protein
MQASCLACTLHADVLPSQEDLRLLRADPLHDHNAALHEYAMQKVVVSRLTTVDAAVRHLVLRPAVSPSQVPVAQPTQLSGVDLLEPLLQR